ncbi:MAG: hypothetical protein F4092_02390 [Rhodospirillaceae bacterium]|nr:hypothetical protein [Rhodospirillaceae bacterium]MYJ70621.1 hypothetical protein [Rhodospirillaceae bacterium]
MIFGSDTEPSPFPPPTRLDKIRSATLRPVVRFSRDGKRWNQFTAPYHHFSQRTLDGTQLGDAVHDPDGRPLAMLGFSTVARKLTRRERFIGCALFRRRELAHARSDHPHMHIRWLTKRPGARPAHRWARRRWRWQARALPRVSWHSSSPRATTTAKLGLDVDPRFTHARAHSLAQAAKHEAVVVERLVASYRFRLEVTVRVPGNERSDKPV